MFALGILATSALWMYWTKHLEPFMPLQVALNEQFEGASARVEGGQRKLHKGTPSVLSIRMRVAFDPNSEGNADKAQHVVDSCVELSKIHVKGMPFDEIVVLMYHQVEEQGASQKKVSVMLNDRFIEEQAEHSGRAEQAEPDDPKAG